MKMYLGKKEKLFDTRTFKFAKYAVALPAMPANHYDTVGKIDPWGVMLNDRIGDCAVAAPGHMIMSWTFMASVMFRPTDDQIVKAYSDISGYNPATGANDNGCYMLDVMNYWRKTGIATRLIGAFADIVPSNFTHIKASVYMFNGTYIGLQLPKSAQDQTGPNKVWTTGCKLVSKYKPGSWGGHAVNIIGYDANYLYCVTWGFVQKMTWAFLKAYCDEAYAIISPDYLSGNKTVDGFDLATLEADLATI